MNNLFLWIIILSFLVPAAIRLYRRSARGRNQSPTLPGGFGGFLPGQSPGQHPGGQNKQPRDGYTQQDYFSGGFRQAGGPAGPPPVPYPGQPYPGQPYDGQPADSQPYPGQPYPAQPADSQPFPGQPYPAQPADSQPSPGQPGGAGAGGFGAQPGSADIPAPPAAPGGFRARKLAELDQRYSNGELSMEDDMAERDAIMNC